MNQKGWNMSVLYDVEAERKFLFTKKVTCTNCEKTFEDIRVLNSKLRRKEPDSDLRPRFHAIDSLKYGVTSCPYCGYSTLSKNFEQLNQLQKRLLEERVCSKFIEREPLAGQIIDYATAVNMYQLALLCAMSMELKISEQAYLCLQLAWLLRGSIEEKEAEPEGITQEDKAQLEEREEHFYRQAYEGLSQALLEEDFPICGMDQGTYEYLLAVLSFHFKEYDMAIRYCGNVVQNREISAKLKDKALMLKDDIVAAKKQDGEAEG